MAKINVVTAAFVAKAKLGFYQNDGRLWLTHHDFLETVGVNVQGQHDMRLINGGVVGEVLYKKLEILASSRAQHFRALFKLLEVRGH